MKLRIRLTKDRCAITRMAPGIPSLLGTLMLRSDADRESITQLVKSAQEATRLRSALREISLILTDLIEDGCPECELEEELHEVSCPYGRLQELCWNLGPEHELEVEIER